MVNMKSGLSPDQKECDSCSIHFLIYEMYPQKVSKNSIFIFK